MVLLSNRKGVWCLNRGRRAMANKKGLRAISLPDSSSDCTVRFRCVHIITEIQTRTLCMYTPRGGCPPLYITWFVCGRGGVLEGGEAVQKAPVGKRPENFIFIKTTGCTSKDIFISGTVVRERWRGLLLLRIAQPRNFPFKTACVGSSVVRARCT